MDSIVLFDYLFIMLLVHRPRPVDGLSSRSCSARSLGGNLNCQFSARFKDFCIHGQGSQIQHKTVVVTSYEIRRDYAFMLGCRI